MSEINYKLPGIFYLLRRPILTIKFRPLGRISTTRLVTSFMSSAFSLPLSQQVLAKSQMFFFDVTRQKATRDWKVDSGQLVATPPPENFPSIDLANDDGTANNSGGGDESNTPSHGNSPQDRDHIYSFDPSGYPFKNVLPGVQITQVIQRKNYNEFVRVSFDGTRPSGPTDKGSRCSPKQSWHMLMWLEAQGANYAEKAGKPNEVDLNHGTLDPAPTP